MTWARLDYSSAVSETFQESMQCVCVYMPAFGELRSFNDRKVGSDAHFQAWDFQTARLSASSLCTTKTPQLANTLKKVNINGQVPYLTF
jgi:hypothetical protein